MHVVHVADDVLEHLADVARADVRRLRMRERLAPPRLQLRPPAHRVLELRPVRLDRERWAARGADRAAKQNVVREDEVGRQLRANSVGVRTDVALALLPRQLLEELRPQPFVAVEHEHR